MGQWESCLQLQPLLKMRRGIGPAAAHRTCMGPEDLQGFLAAGAFLGSALAAAVVFTVMPHSSILSTGSWTFGEGYMDFKVPMTVEVYKKFKLSLPRPYVFSGNVAELPGSQCCDTFGLQCLTKNAKIRACLEWCEPAKLFNQGNGTWTCKPAGVWNRCANTEGCGGYGCCASDNHRVLGRATVRSSVGA